MLRDYTRLCTDLNGGTRTRYWQRLEKLLENALIKITTVASRIDGVSVREMIEALIAGQRDPRVLAGLARGRMRIKHAALVEALNGRFDDHHGELARMLLDQIDSLNARPVPAVARLEHDLRGLPGPSHHRSQVLRIVADPRGLQQLTSLGHPHQHAALTVG